MAGNSQGVAASWQNPDFRKSRMDGLSAARKDPEKEARRIAGIRAAMQRPDVQEKLRGPRLTKTGKPKDKYKGSWEHRFARVLTKEEILHANKCRRCGLKIEDVAKDLKTEVRI